MATRIDVEGAKSWSTQPGDEWITVPEAEARLALLEKKAALADEVYAAIAANLAGSPWLSHWLARYDALEAPR